MAPIPYRNKLTLEGLILEAWAEGYNVGSLIILILIVFCNYRRGIVLHKLILLELVLALLHGTFIFVSDPAYGWYLSTTATLLFISYQVHNVVSWLKIRPFLPRWGSRVFILSLLAVQPFWIVECWSNWAYFNKGVGVNDKTRPWEALFRDPWWIFTTWKLVDVIRKSYNLRVWELIRISPRFGVQLGCMGLSIVFLLTDVIITALHVSVDAGINPYWRLALVFKCASDTIFLDDFKSVLDDIVARALSNAGGATVRLARRRRVSDKVPKESKGSNGSYPSGAYGEFIECGPITTHITSPQATRTSEKDLRFPFTHRSHSRHASGPKINVTTETTVTSESRKRSGESYDSEHGILPGNQDPGLPIHRHGDTSFSSLPDSRADSGNNDMV